MAVEPTEMVNIVVEFDAVQVSPMYLADTLLEVEGVVSVNITPAH